ncbi:FUSC family protein [Aurantiacibacter odishensis]|uniref:FUSC family protein n=1 Tax=Aurantiacibacter odishensis TaxID=1155476 RepID=UPI000E71D6CB|nr:FUSC family protein [Aurantiacibacter odishensis]
MLERLQENWRRAFRESLESALAAGIAWWIGTLVFGPEHTPLFAAVAAVVSLAPGLPSHSRQALGLLLGVVVGIVVGEAALALAGEVQPPVMALAVFAAIMLAIAFEVQPIIGIQAGVSAVIVLVEGQGESSYARVIDALIGGGVALAFSQVLLTPDPFGILRKEGAKLMRAADTLHEALCRCRDGKSGRDEVESALRDMDRAAMSLDEQLEYVGRIAQRTFRGRLYKARIEARTEQWRVCSKRLRLSLSDVAHTMLAREGSEDDGSKLDEAARWVEAGQSLSQGKDDRFHSVTQAEDEGVWK